MIDPQHFIQKLQGKGIQFFTGVPDSTLKELSAYLARTLSSTQHLIAANEGNAIGLAIGHFLAKNTPAAVYMQNSGLGNAVNPLTSLADKAVYGIPMLLIVGWRGEPGKKDEPQHITQGRITPGLLDCLGIPYRVLEDIQTLEVLWPLLQERQPVALLVPVGTFSFYPSSVEKQEVASSLQREEALAVLLEALAQEDCLIATTGKSGRELFELRIRRQETPYDFLTVGGMGHASSIALGVALAMPDRRIVCLDGDGALIMHLGAMGVIGSLRPTNFLHVLLNNYCHESVGGQPTCSASMDFAKISAACGYASYARATSVENLTTAICCLQGKKGPHFLEICLLPGSRPDLGRPTTSPLQNGQQFMKHLQCPGITAIP
ncbi:MAG: phosphonopyruvate decarboxylase [Holosporales bacterium]|jgi:phosphonopyruvate decarboxylase|nr:phosphonopyruvate decarboxylase [Holosporales bacterium]